MPEYKVAFNMAIGKCLCMMPLARYLTYFLATLFYLQSHLMASSTARPSRVHLMVTFKAWLEGLLEEMNPYLEPKSVLVVDNCAIHHVEGVQEMCDER